ncbi:MAG: PASTA domain-containing protein, partial [Planctomycetia bacterium]
MACPSLPLRAARLAPALLLAAAAGLWAVGAREAARAAHADEPAPAAAPKAPVPAEVSVPDLALSTLPAAARALAEAGRVLERIYEARYSQGYALGLVVQQKPRPGLSVPRGTGVRVMVSAAQAGLPEGRAPQAADLGLAAPDAPPAPAGQPAPEAQPAPEVPVPAAPPTVPA